MKTRIEFRPEAECDLAEAQHWYESRQAGLGFEFLNSFDMKLQSVAEAPGRHAPVHRGVRMTCMDRFPYVLYYRWSNGVVEILAVVHASRDPEVWLRRTQ